LEAAPIIHGTTLVANALNERKGAPTPLITTGGARDILETGKENRYDPYDRLLTRPRPLVPRHLRRTVGERVSATGAVVAALDEDEVGRVLQELVADGVEAVAVCFLHSYKNPAHEHLVRSVAASLGLRLYLSLSSDINAEIGEFERVTTTTANATIQPIAEGYLRTLRRDLVQAGHRGGFFLMWSDGGLASVESTLDAPIRLLESGPAAGALAAGHLARTASLDRVIAFDMGGTTAKICLVNHHEPSRSSALEIGRVHRDKAGSGTAVRVPSVALLEIGAGGGSLASIDAMGLLKVGPESAGAEPGPACYGLGGKGATVTDANLLLGYLDASQPLAGDLRLDEGLARRAVGKLAGRLELAVEDTAKGIRRVVNEKMAQAIRLHVTESGKDPRDYVLMAFGGAAPLHVYDLARALGIRRVVIDSRAGVLSAFGFLTVPPGLELVHTFIAPLAELRLDALGEKLDQLRRQALEVLVSAGLTEDQVELHYALDMRYRGQGFEVTVPIGDGIPPTPEALELAFTEAYRRRYGLQHRGAVEIRACRLRAKGPDPNLEPSPVTVAATAGHPSQKRSIWFDDPGSWLEATVYRLSDLPIGQRLEGPLLVEVDHTSVVVGPAGVLTVVEPSGELVMEVAPRTHLSLTAAGPVDLEIALARLRAIADEADRTLLRTAFSSVVREAKDYSLLITDVQGRSLAFPTECMPLFVTSMPRTIKLLNRHFPPASLEPGDLIFTNDPWLCAGHKSDLVLVAPVYHRSRLVAFVGTILHVEDIGGTLGDFRAWDIYEEGLSIPPIKLFDRGRLNEAVEAILLANVRLPEQVLGDIAAMRAAIEVASRRLNDLLDEAAEMDLRVLVDEVSKRAQRAMSAQLRSLPVGNHAAKLAVDGVFDDQQHAYPAIHLAVEARVERDELVFDFSGSQEQLARKAINVPISYTEADTVYAMQYLLGSDIPTIAPQFSPIKIEAPEGSILNAKPPVPVYARTRTGLHISTLINAALAEAMPDSVQAGCGHTIIFSVAGHRDDGSYFQVTFMPKGGMGATGGRDGWNCTVFPTNSTMISSEIAESLCPVLVSREIRCDSGGAGRDRGGHGQVITVRSIASTPLLLAFRPNFMTHPPVGLLGGRSGVATHIEVNGEPLRENPVQLLPGGWCRVFTAGGGGIGNALERDVERVVADVSAGLVGVRGARETYGVEIDPATGRVDVAKTKELRQRVMSKQ
ncbi:MAG: hydantoinase B/oxoprolinase family protein, partial [Trueperaceae bacterium]